MNDVNCHFFTVDICYQIEDISVNSLIAKNFTLKKKSRIGVKFGQIFFSTSLQIII